MTTFFEYLAESNSAGSEFEKLITKNVNEWLKSNDLSRKFKASHFQGGQSRKMIETEDLGGRSEDYSDIMIRHQDSGEVFFIECKEAKANFVTIQFDFKEDGKVVPVFGKSREQLEDEVASRLAERIEENEGYQEFTEFLNSPCKLINDNTPGDYWFNRKDADDQTIRSLMTKYNRFLKSGKAESDCKPFDSKLVRESTRNTLVCGLCWRLSDQRRTWDVFSVDDIDFFGELIQAHYASKKIPAKYIQVDDSLFVLNESDNPLRIDAPTLSKDLHGRFDMKFTPRFGSGSMYLSPRSKLTSKLESAASFKTKSKWPNIQSGK